MFVTWSPSKIGFKLSGSAEILNDYHILVQFHKVQMIQLSLSTA
jgi:hypothetical protein